MMDCLDPLYVDRTKSCGATQQIIDRAEDINRWPLLIFPEGTIAGGSVMLKFHRGGFLTTRYIQPVLMRLVTPFMPAHWNTYIWTSQPLWELLWALFTMPFSICWLKWLSAEPGVGPKGDAEIAAERMQIAMANELGVKAVNAGSDLLFHNKYRPRREGENKEPVARRDPPQ
jgi:hypothetical protein